MADKEDLGLWSATKLCGAAFLGAVLLVGIFNNTSLGKAFNKAVDSSATVTLPDCKTKTSDTFAGPGGQKYTISCNSK